MRLVRNHKGLTLIELIVSLLILSIATLMFYSSFSVVLRTMKEGNDIKNSMIKINAAIDSDMAADGSGEIINIKNDTATLTLKDGTSLSTSGSMMEGSISYSDEDTLTLARFTTKVYVFTENEKQATSFYKQIQSIYGTGLNAEGVAYINDLRKKDSKYDEKITAWIGQAYFGPDNTLFRRFLYVGYFNDINNTTDYRWPTLNISKMKLKDGTSLTSFKGVSETNTYYIQPYFYQPSAVDGYIIYANLADNPLTNTSQWGTQFIFNSDDQHWYFRKTGTIQLAGADTLGSCKEGYTSVCLDNWKKIKSNMRKGLDGWERIYEVE